MNVCEKYAVSGGCPDGDECPNYHKRRRFNVIKKFGRLSASSNSTKWYSDVKTTKSKGTTADAKHPDVDHKSDKGDVNECRYYDVLGSGGEDESDENGGRSSRCEVKKSKRDIFDASFIPF